MDNENLFDSISKRDGVELVIDLDNNFQDDLEAFRKETSKSRTLNGIDYPSVYLTENDYGGLRILFDNGKELRLIINLEFYYVYGFFLDDNNVYAFKGVSEDALKKFGFETITIPYSDGYFDIKEELTDDEFNDLLSTTVEFSQITTALNQIVDATIPFTKKAKSILVVFWSLVEGIRFAGISNVVGGLIQGNPSDYIYDYFYELAEIWAKLSVITVYDKNLNPDIAVYELHRIP